MVVQRLGWARADVLTARAKEVVAVVMRAADLATIAKLRSGMDADARAFQLFSQPAPKSWLVRRVRALYLDQAVRDFFNKTLKTRPTLTQWLDKASVHIWFKIFGRPHVSGRGLAAMPILSAIAMIGTYIAGAVGVLPSDSGGAAFLLALCVGPGLVLLKLYAFSWPVTLLLRRLKEKKPPSWVRWGWLAAGALGVLLVSSLPATWPLAGVSLVFSAGLLVWATIAAHPVFVAEGLGFYQKLKLALMENPLVLFWTGVVGWRVGVPACIATAGVFGANAIAGRSMARIWKFDCPPHIRHWSLVALSLLPIAAFYTLWWSSDSPLKMGFSTALVTVAALLQRPARLSLPQALMTRWLQIIVMVTFPVMFVVPYLVAADLLNTKAAVRVAGTYVLIGVGATVCLSLFAEGTTSRLFRRVSAQA